MSKDEALKMAIKKIEKLNYDAFGYFPDECANNEAIKACKEALEQPAQGIELEWYNKGWTDANWEWQGLTDDEIKEFMGNCWESPYHLIKVIEQELKDKNT
jgi:hypothetical protein